MRHVCSGVGIVGIVMGSAGLRPHVLRSRVLFIVMCSRDRALVNLVSLRTQPVMPVVLC